MYILKTKDESELEKKVPEKKPFLNLMLYKVQFGNIILCKIRISELQALIVFSLQTFRVYFFLPYIDFFFYPDFYDFRQKKKQLKISFELIFFFTYAYDVIRTENEKSFLKLTKNE